MSSLQAHTFNMSSLQAHTFCDTWMIIYTVTWCSLNKEHEVYMTILTKVNQAWNIGHCNWRGVIVFNATFNNISIIYWQSVLLVKETVVPGENHWPVASHWQTLSHNVVSSRPHLSGIQTLNVSGDGHWLHRSL
jgi:hypothetical protein